MSVLPNELDVLRDVSRRLDSANIPFMLTGSLAMNFYAVPRMTRDIDVVVELPSIRTRAVASLFEPDYYVSEEGILDAVKHSTLFNIIHQASVIKVDCIIRKQTPYRLEEFKRRVRLQAAGFETWIVTKEDLILSKLAWFAESGSERQLSDLRTLLPTGFDGEYVTHWVRELGLAESWENTASG